MTVRNGTATLPPPATAAARARRPIDDGLLHVWLDDVPHRYLCGKPRHGDTPCEPYGDTPPRREDCQVCVDLAETFIAGRWRP